MSRLHAVMPHRPNSEVSRRIQEKFPDAYEHTDSLFPVRGSPVTLASTIATDIGLKGAGRVEDSSGAVFKLNRGHSGFTRPDLRDWLSNPE